MRRAAGLLLALLLLAAPVLGQSVTARNHYKLARSCAQKSQWADALPYLEKALQEDPGYVDAHFLKGLCHLALKQYEPAAAHLKKVIEEDPQFLPAYQTLGNVYLQQQKYSEAQAHFQRMLMVPKAAPTARYSLGVVAYVQGDLATAEQCFREATRLDPKMAGAFHNLGAVLQVQGKPRLALGSFQEAVRLDPGKARYLLSLGLLYLDLQTPKEADKTLNDARLKAGAEERDISGTAEAGLALLKGNYAVAADLAAKARQANAEATSASLLEARALERLERPAEAREAYQRALDSDPNLSEARRALERLGKAAEESKAWK